MRIKAQVGTAAMMVGLALCACTPQLSQPSGMALPQSRLATTCSLPTFLRKVHYLAQTTPPFSLPDSGFAYAPPIDPRPMNNGNITQDLTDAFNNAPDFFQKQLCNLTGIYIDRTGCSSYDPSSCIGRDPSGRLWGFRAFDDAGNSAGEFIGTWLGLWQRGDQGHAPVFSKFETGRLQALLNWKSSNPPVHDYVNPDTVKMTMLAVLAHEVGHILWYDAFVVKADGSPKPGGPPDFNQFCSGTFYQPRGVGQGSWRFPPTVPDKRWVSFGQQRNYHKTDDVDMKEFLDDLNKGKYPEAGDLLHGIYSSGRWASALAAFSTDEDFVETFQLFVLRHAHTPLLHSRVRIFGSHGLIYNNIPFTFDQKSELVRKSDCFDYLRS